MSKLRFRVVETAFKKKAATVETPEMNDLKELEKQTDKE